MNYFDFKNKVVLITGVDRGMGQKYALEFAKNGAFIIGVDMGNFDETKSLLEKENAEFDYFKVDLSKSNEIYAFIETINKKYSKVDVLINNAGVIVLGKTVEMTDEDYDKVMNINLKAMFIISREIGKIMIKNLYGKIINTASIHGISGGFDSAPYVASKHAVIGLTKALSNEWAGYGINVNAIAPGFTATDNTKKLREQTNIVDEINKRIPMHRFAETDDIVGSVLFLASDLSNYVNGHTLIIDGGVLNN